MSECGSCKHDFTDIREEPCNSCSAMYADEPESQWEPIDKPQQEPAELSTVNPKQIAGDKKDPLHLVPSVGIREEAKALKIGALKYGEYNWRDGIEAMTYVAAILRHLFQFVDGEDVDEESGLSHISHIKASCAILLDAASVGKLLDNRPKT